MWLLTALVHRLGRQLRRNDVTCRKIKKRVEKINTIFNRREQFHSIVEQHVSQVRAHTFYIGVHFCQYSHNMICRHYSKIAKSEYYVRLSVSLSVRPSSRMEQLRSQLTDFHEIWYLNIFRKPIEKIKISLTSEKNNGYFSWRSVHIYELMLNSCKEREMFQTKFAQKFKTHILCSVNSPPRKSCRLWDNVERCGTAGQATDDNTVRRMRFACWIPKATNTHSEYVILIAFPLQQWLRERALILRYMYIGCLASVYYFIWRKVI